MGYSRPQKNFFYFDRNYKPSTHIMTKISKILFHQKRLNSFQLFYLVCHGLKYFVDSDFNVFRKFKIKRTVSKTYDYSNQKPTYSLKKLSRKFATFSASENRNIRDTAT